jgi:hypothetical protein
MANHGWNNVDGIYTAVDSQYFNRAGRIILLNWIFVIKSSECPFVPFGSRMACRSLQELVEQNFIKQSSEFVLFRRDRIVQFR